MMKIIKNKRVLYVVFGIYMFILISILIFKFPTGMVSAALKKLVDGGEIHRSPMQLVPFKTIIEYAKNVHSLTDWFIKNLACNVIMFMPLGIFVPLMFGKGPTEGAKTSDNRKNTNNLNDANNTNSEINIKRTRSIMVWGKEIPSIVVVLLAGFLLSVAIETVQYITCLGLCDIDDVILNTFGSVLGYMMLCISWKWADR